MRVKGRPRMSRFSVVMMRSRDGSPAAYSAQVGSRNRLVLSGNSLAYTGQGFELFAETEGRESDRIWLERCDQPAGNQSFVVVFGWCYRKSSTEPTLNDGDCRAVLESHRRHETIDLDDFSGNYCILSYDHLSDTLWCCSDLWVQQGFCFGASRELVAVGSRAAWVADQLCAQVDGYSYLTMLRGAAVVPGRTLFAGVHAITPGLCLKLDIGERSATLVRTADIWMPPLNISFGEALDRAVDVVSKVVRRASCLPRTAVDLTGGNDSRLSAAVLSSPGCVEFSRRITFKVHADADHPDAIVAGRIAREFDWTLRRYDRRWDLPIADDTMDALREVAVLSDGQRFPSDLARGLANERNHWADQTHLVGSVSGELFRDHNYWYQELFNMGRTDTVNYDALLTHSLSATPDLDFARVSRGAVTRQDHDSYLKSGYHLIESGAPALSNVHKLDRIAVHKALSANEHWRYSGLRTMHLPYHSAEATDVSLRLPWRYRLGRQLSTRMVERLSPRLTGIPTNRGAPMRPLRIGTVGSYLRFHTWDSAERLNRHFGPGRRLKDRPRTDPSLPRAWLNYIRDNRAVRGLCDCSTVLDRAESGLPAPESRELQLLLLLAALKDAYPRLELRLDFEHSEPLVPPNRMSTIAGEETHEPRSKN